MGTDAEHQNPDTDAYVLMRPVPLAQLDGPETFGAIVEDVLFQVDNWRELMNGMQAAEAQKEKQTEESDRLAAGGFMQVCVVAIDRAVPYAIMRNCFRTWCPGHGPDERV